MAGGCGVLAPMPYKGEEWGLMDGRVKSGAAPTQLPQRTPAHVPTPLRTHMHRSNREHGVRVQIGGSDQWGNITAGTDLIRRLLGGGTAASVSSYDSSASEPEAEGAGGGGGGEAPACFGLTFPLLVRGRGWVLPGELAAEVYSND